MTYVALLRGINVSGRNAIKMSALVNVFESLSFRNVGTYVQSGNVIFEDDFVDASKLAARIETKIDDAVGMKVRVIIRTLDEPG
jgi:uncharacterized protein (DUF1697 family)